MCDNTTARWRAGLVACSSCSGTETSLAGLPLAHWTGLGSPRCATVAGRKQHTSGPCRSRRRCARELLLRSVNPSPPEIRATRRDRLPSKPPPAARRRRTAAARRAARAARGPRGQARPKRGGAARTRRPASPPRGGSRPAAEIQRPGRSRAARTSLFVSARPLGPPLVLGGGDAHCHPEHVPAPPSEAHPHNTSDVAVCWPRTDPRRTSGQPGAGRSCRKAGSRHPRLSRSRGVGLHGQCSCLASWLDDGGGRTNFDFEEHFCVETRPPTRDIAPHTACPRGVTINACSAQVA